MELAWLYCAGVTSLVQCSSLLHFVSAILVFIARPPIGLFCLQSPTKCVLILHIMWWTFKFLINSIFQFNLLPWLVGAIIGSKGSKISQTRQESGANIKVSDETLPQSTEKTVQVKGVTQSVLSAVQIILNQLSEVTDRAPRQVYTPQSETSNASFVNQQQQYLQPYQPVNSFFSQPSQPMQQTLQPQAQSAHHFYVDYFWV